MNPTDADPLTDLESAGSSAVFFHPSDNLVAEDNGETRRRSSPFDFIQLGVTNPAAGHFYLYFKVFWQRGGQVSDFQWVLSLLQITKLIQNRGFHYFIIA